MNRRRSRALLSGLALLSGVGCGSSPPPAPAAPPPAPPVAATPPPPDLSPAPEPEGLIVFARAAKPSEALKVIGGWVQFPVPGPAEVSSLLTGESFANLIDLDQPIDFALTLRDRQPRGAMSAAVKSLDDAKAAFAKYKLVPVENGALRVDGLGKPDDADKDGDEGEARICELVPAFSGAHATATASGAPATRLICAESEPTLRALAPWLARTAPRAAYPADVHVELRLAPVRPLVDQMRRALPMFVGSALGVHRTGVPEIDDAFRDAVGDLADFTSDANTLAFDAMVGEPQATVTFTSRFRSTTSFLARLAVGHPERAAAPPASFWKLPADADAAFFHGGIDPADFEHPRDHVADVLGAALAKEGLGDTDRKAIRDAASHTLDLFALRSEYAKGVDLEAAQKAAAAIKAVKPGDKAAFDEAERVAAETMAGWLVVGVDAPAAKVGGIEKEWAAAWSRPGVVKWVRANAGDTPPTIARMAPVPKGITAKDAAHLELVVSTPRPRADDESDAAGKKKAKKSPPSKPIVLHALVVPDGAASWVVFTADEALGVAKANELLAGSTALAARPGLASMKDARMNAGGFVSPRTFRVGDVFSWTFSPRWTELGRMARAGSEAALTPIPLQFTTEPANNDSPAGTSIATLTVPKAAIATIFRMAMH